jgi:hypothetical protein
MFAFAMPTYVPSGRNQLRRCRADDRRMFGKAERPSTEFVSASDANWN